MDIEEIFYGETDNIEFKEMIPAKSEKYMKTVVAFANGTGGKIVFGVEDGTWKVTGFSKNEIFQKMDAVTNAIYDSCEPRIIPNVAVQDVGGKSIIVVEIPAGMQRPYYIKSLGVTDGTFVRVACTTRIATWYRLQELIMEGSNRSFDQIKNDKPVSEVQLSDFCEEIYRHAQSLCNSDESMMQVQKITKNQLLSWKLIVEQDGRYYPTNGYLLLDGKQDKFPDATIQCAVFKGTVRDIFITRKEFKGSIYQQVEDAYSFVLQHINLGSRIEGLYREDIYELPIKSVREMIANAVCHRSYLAPGKIQVALFDDRLEVTSPGMLDNEITIEKMKTGLSKIRNKGIAAAFSYMNVIEAWGSGIPRMFREAEEFGLPEPELINMGSDFRVNFFRCKLGVDQNGVINPVVKETTQATRTTQATQATQAAQAAQVPIQAFLVTFSDSDKAVLDLIYDRPYITQKEIALELGWKVDRVKYYLNKMKKQQIIKRVGSSQKGHWEFEIEWRIR